MPPKNVRPKRIGKDIGLRHSSILHHLGSRDGLMEQLRKHAIDATCRDLAQRIAVPPQDDPAINFFEKVAETPKNQGYGRPLAWQLLSENLSDRGAVSAAAPDPQGCEGLLAGLANQIQRMRAARAERYGQPIPGPKETQRIVIVWQRLRHLCAPVDHETHGLPQDEPMGSSRGD